MMPTKYEPHTVCLTITPNKHLYAVNTKSYSDSTAEIFAILCTECTQDILGETLVFVPWDVGTLDVTYQPFVLSFAWKSRIFTSISAAIFQTLFIHWLKFCWNPHADYHWPTAILSSLAYSFSHCVILIFFSSNKITAKNAPVLFYIRMPWHAGKRKLFF